MFLDDEPPFFNIGGTSANGSNYKGKEVAIIDDKKGFRRKLKWGEPISYTVHEFIKKDQMAGAQVQEMAEDIYGKEFFSKREPPVVGLHTTMLATVIRSSQINSSQSPPLFAADTNTTTTVATNNNHQRSSMQRSSARDPTTQDHDHNFRNPNQQQHTSNSRMMSRRPPAHFKDFYM